MEPYGLTRARRAKLVIPFDAFQAELGSKQYSGFGPASAVPSFRVVRPGGNELRSPRGGTDRR